MEGRVPLLEVRDLVKFFGGVQALRGVSFKLFPREVLALLGDNGAGKSTTIKIISGYLQPDEGEIFLEGRKVVFSSPSHARSMGIETVYQDLALFGVLDVTTNLFMGREVHRFGMLQRRAMERETWKILDKMKTTIKSIRQKVKTLSGGQQHAVAIGRSVYVGSTPKILIMDEPTAGLGVEESQKILELISELRERGISIILISHNLEHVFCVADRIVVLRSGEVVGEKRTNETSQSEIVHMMMGVTC
ncbi:MAG TPA: sugar ABC transporter ATP-binding protein [Candidatus Atribacteria bacterium]|nr:sugar ABC transporter ATP-binding protein [Candidatus Atribacteria bacterium]